MPTIDPTSTAFLLAESRVQPMHVGGLQLFAPAVDSPPRGAARALYERALETAEVAPLFRKHPRWSLGALGRWVWAQDRDFDLGHHVRHNALPRPARIRELLELCSRLHGTQLARDRPLWEVHIVEGLPDGQVAVYTKIHHALVDGVSAMRLMQSVMSTDPDERGMALPFGVLGPQRRSRPQTDLATRLGQLPVSTLRSALAVSADAAGMPGALVRTLARGVRNETSALSLHAPRTMFNVPISGARRVAAQSWPLERLRAIRTATGVSLNDVVLAMTGGAVRRYLLEQDALPETPLVAMVPVGLNAKQAGVASTEGGVAIGAVMAQLGTHLVDPADRLRSVHASMADGKEALASMTPTQIVAMSALGMAPSLAIPMLRLTGVLRPPVNLIISNVPGPRETMYFNGMQMLGNYPLSIPINGMALNITCVSYADDMCFGLTGCRRSVPHLQRLLTHLEDELTALEQACGAR